MTAVQLPSPMRPRRNALASALPGAMEQYSQQQQPGLTSAPGDLPPPPDMMPPDQPPPDPGAGGGGSGNPPAVVFVNGQAVQLTPEMIRPPVQGGNQGAGGFQTWDGVSPANIANPNPDFGNWREFSDAAYSEMARSLDPQFQAQEARFRQQMVNQGIAEGSTAWDNAYSNFSRSRNDAYDQARRSSIGVGLNAQNQAFGQNAMEAQLANALQLAQMNNSNSYNIAQIGAGAEAGRLGLARDQFTEDTRRWDLGRGDSLGQQDFQNMMTAMGFDFGMNQYNNSLNQDDLGQLLPFLGMIPQANPTPIDVTGPYQIWAGINANNANAAANRSNGIWGSVGQLGAAALPFILSDRAAKEPIAQVDTSAAVEAALALPIETWRYVGEATPHIGTYAQDFHRLYGLPESKTISFIDAFGAMFATMKGVVAELRALRDEVAQLKTERSHA